MNMLVPGSANMQVPARQGNYNVPTGTPTAGVTPTVRTPRKSIDPYTPKKPAERKSEEYLYEPAYGNGSSGGQGSAGGNVKLEVQVDVIGQMVTNLVFQQKLKKAMAQTAQDEIQKALNDAIGAG
jgi:hypothetical protein